MSTRPEPMEQDIQIALVLSEKAWRYRDEQFLKHNKSVPLHEFFNFPGSEYTGPLNINSVIGTKEDPIWNGEYWHFTDSKTKQQYANLIPDLYLLLSKLDEEGLEYKFIEVSERQLLIRGKFKTDITFQFRIFPFEMRWVSI